MSHPNSRSTNNFIWWHCLWIVPGLGRPVVLCRTFLVQYYSRNREAHLCAVYTYVYVHILQANTLQLPVYVCRSQLLMCAPGVLLVVGDGVEVDVAACWFTLCVLSETLTNS